MGPQITKPSEELELLEHLKSLRARVENDSPEAEILDKAIEELEKAISEENDKKKKERKKAVLRWLLRLYMLKDEILDALEELADWIGP